MLNTIRIHLKLVGIALVLLMLGVLFAGWYHSNSAKSSTAPYRYSYAKLSHFKLPNQKGAAITFDLPSAAQQVTGLPAGQNSVEFVHNRSVGGKTATIAYEAAAANTVKNPIDNQYLSDLDKALTNSKDVSHASDQQPILSFLSQRINKRYLITLGEGSNLRTQNLKNNAWVFDFTARDSKVIDSKIPNKMTGKVILAAGKQTYYYFMVSSVDYNWTTNQPVWDRIINSIKIDQ